MDPHAIYEQRAAQLARELAGLQEERRANMASGYYDTHFMENVTSNSAIRRKQVDLKTLRTEQADMERVWQRSRAMDSASAMRAALATMCAGMAKLEARRAQDRASTYARICRRHEAGQQQDVCDALLAEEADTRRHVARLTALEQLAERARTLPEAERVRDLVVDELQAIERRVQAEELRIGTFATRIGGNVLEPPASGSWLPAWVHRVVASLRQAWELLRGGSVADVWQAVSGMVFGDGSGDAAVDGGDENAGADLPDALPLRPPDEAFAPDTGKWRSPFMEQLWTGVRTSWETVLQVCRRTHTFSQWLFLGWIRSNPADIRHNLTRLASMMRGTPAYFTLLAIGLWRDSTMAVGVLIVAMIANFAGLTETYIVGLGLAHVYAAMQWAPLLKHLVDFAGPGNSIGAVFGLAFVATWCERWVRARQLQVVDQLRPGARPGRTFDSYLEAVDADQTHSKWSTRMFTTFLLLVTALPLRHQLHQLSIAHVGTAGTYLNRSDWILQSAMVVGAPYVSQLRDTLPLTGQKMFDSWFRLAREDIGSDIRAAIPGIENIRDPLVAVTTNQFAGGVYDTEQENREYSNELTHRYRTPGRGDRLVAMVKWQAQFRAGNGPPLPPDFPLSGAGLYYALSSETVPLPEGLDPREQAVIDLALQQLDKQGQGNRTWAVLAANMNRVVRARAIESGSMYDVGDADTATALTSYSRQVDGDWVPDGMITAVPEPSDGVVLVRTGPDTARYLQVVEDDLGRLLALAIWDMMGVVADQDTSLWGAVHMAGMHAPELLVPRVGEAIIGMTIQTAATQALGFERAKQLTDTVLVTMTDELPQVVSFIGHLSLAAAAGSTVFMASGVLTLYAGSGLVAGAKVATASGVLTTVVVGGWAFMAYEPSNQLLLGPGDVRATDQNVAVLGQVMRNFFAWAGQAAADYEAHRLALPAPQAFPPFEQLAIAMAPAAAHVTMTSVAMARARRLDSP